MKILLLFIILFFINNVSAETIFQENFETQTVGNFTLTAGSPTFITTSPFGYFLNQPSGTGFSLSIFNDSIQQFTNFSNTFYVRINPQNNYDFEFTACDLGCNQYINVLLQNRTGDLNNYYVELWDGSILDSLNINTVNLSSYNDSFGYVKVELKYQNNGMLLYIDDNLINTYNASTTFTSNFTELYYDISLAFNFGLDEVTLNTISTSITNETINTIDDTASLDLWVDISGLLKILIFVYILSFIFIVLMDGVTNKTIEQLIAIAIGIIALVVLYSLVALVGGLISELL